MTLTQTHSTTHKRKSMGWVIFVAGAVLSWGAYGVFLQQGQVQLGNPLKALLCVGVAYFLIAVLIPIGGLSAQGGLSGFNTGGLMRATLGGALGAAGAVCIIWAFKSAGLPIYVMPRVFGGPPIGNVLPAMVLRPPQSSTNPITHPACLLASL